MTGKEVWQRMRSEGGFCWTHADGSITIHFNAGFKPSAELAALVRAHSADLKLFVMERNAADERAATPPGLGSFGRIPRHDPTRDDSGTRDCNAVARLEISSKCSKIAFCMVAAIFCCTFSGQKAGFNEIIFAEVGSRADTVVVGPGGGLWNMCEISRTSTGRGCTC